MPLEKCRKEGWLRAVGEDYFEVMSRNTQFGMVDHGAGLSFPDSLLRLKGLRIVGSRTPPDYWWINT